MAIDLIAIQNTVTKEDVRHIMAHNPLEPLARSTVDQMIAVGELKEPNKRGRYRIWTKSYIAGVSDMSIEDLNDILRVIDQLKKAS